jgi:cobalamin biosynthesis protein CobD/CbiB
MAGCLGVRLGGPSNYAGVLVQKPFIGDDRIGDYAMASEQSIGIVLLASCIAVLAAVAAVWLGVQA